MERFGNELKMKFSLTLTQSEIELIVEALSLYKDAECKAVLGVFDSNGKMKTQEFMQSLGAGEFARLISDGEDYLKHVPVGPPHTKMDKFRLDKMWDGFMKIIGKIESRNEERWEQKAEDSIGDVVDSLYEMLKEENND